MRRIVMSLLPLLLAAPLVGQTTVGLRAGPSRSTLDSEVFGSTPDVIADGLDLDLEEGTRVRMVAGVDVTFPFAGAVELRVGAAYSQKGQRQFAEFALEGASLSMESSLDLDYFQLSTLARVGTPRAGRISVGALLGPWAAFRTACNISGGVTGGSVDLTEVLGRTVSAPCETFGTANDMKSTDFGIAAGATAELAVAENLRLGLDLVYLVGLANISAVDEPPYNTNARTRSLAIQAGVLIPLGG